MRLLATIASQTPALPATTLDKLKEIPPEFWMRLGFAVLVLIALVFFLRKVAKMNKVVLTVVIFMVATIGGFNWIYERSEPAWATPVVSFLAGFFPTKGLPPKPPGSVLAQKH
jgi:hypothetical protein